MNTAERTAYQFYHKHHLESMPENVKRQLIILMLSHEGDDEDEAYDYTLNTVEDISTRSFTMEEIEGRLSQAEADAQSGNVYSCEEVHKRIEEKNPWLCE